MMTKDNLLQHSSCNIRISVILTTFNQPALLKAALTGLSHQDFDGFEVVIADDGSDEPTRDVIREANKVFPHLKIKHVWAEHDGFRVARMRNLAVQEAKGDYLVFLDGDCLAPPDFLSRHWNLREEGWAIYGQRIIASESYSADIVAAPERLYTETFWTFSKLWQLALSKKTNRVLPALAISPTYSYRKWRSKKWQNFRCCNCAVWKKDYLAIRGSDESFCGWGSEDKDLAVRLINNDVRIKDGRCYSYVLHLWHPIANKQNDLVHSEIVKQRVRRHEIFPRKGLPPLCKVPYASNDKLFQGKDKPLVSILVPCYNATKFIDECLQSIRKQTYRSLEILCINDGSTDGTLEKLNQYAALDKRIRIIDKRNTGYGDSMNIGLDEARGDYIGIVESDDFVEPDMVEALLTTALADDLDVARGGWFFHMSADNEDVETTGLGFPKNETLKPSDYPIIFRQQPSIWASLYKKSFLQKNQIRFLPTPGASYQDTSFTFKVYALAEKFKMLDRAFVHYRIDNESSSIHDQGKIYCVCDEYAEIWKFVNTSSARLKAFASLVTLLQFESYRWNFNRLRGESQKAFLAAWGKELREQMSDLSFCWNALNFKKKRQALMVAFVPRYVRRRKYVS